MHVQVASFPKTSINIERLLTWSIGRLLFSSLFWILSTHRDAINSGERDASHSRSMSYETSKEFYMYIFCDIGF